MRINKDTFEVALNIVECYAKETKEYLKNLEEVEPI